MYFCSAMKQPEEYRSELSLFRNGQRIYLRLSLITIFYAPSLLPFVRLILRSSLYYRAHLSHVQKLVFSFVNLGWLICFLICFVYEIYNKTRRGTSRPICRGAFHRITDTIGVVFNTTLKTGTTCCCIVNSRDEIARSRQ